MDINTTNGQNEVAASLREKGITIESIESKIEEVLTNCFDEEYVGELGGKWVLLANNAASFWNKGVSLAHIENEEGYAEDKLFTIEDYAESFADIFMEGQAIIRDMANDIYECIVKCEFKL